VSAVQFEKNGSIAIVTLNRPEARNAISPEVMVKLDEAWSTVTNDDEIRVAILTGVGDKAFSAGADLAKTIPLMSGAKEPEDEWDKRFVNDRGLGGRALLRDIQVPKPIIAACNGHAIAGGMELVQGTDLRISVPEARFGVQEVKWGLFPAGGSTVRLPRQVPYARAMELLLTGDLLSADEALELGFLNRVVPRAELMKTATELAEKIAANGPLAVRAVLRSARECVGLKEQEAMRVESRHAGPVFQSKDAVEGPRAFLEKRGPVFVGK
jgi:enoyl-CoA hydratase